MTSSDSIIIEIERVLMNADISPLKPFFECHENYPVHLDLVVRPFLLAIANGPIIKNCIHMFSSEIEHAESHVRQSLDFYVDKFIERGIKEYRKYGPLT
jgi:hypothetical protein